MENTLPINPPEAAEYPSLSDRVQSTFIDSIFILMMMFVFASILDKYENPPDWIRIVLFFGLWAIYEPLCTTLGFTIGNYIKGIRVRQYSNTKKRINFFQALLRYIIKILLGWISFLTIHMTTEKRAIHDMAAGSVMIMK
jgi:uncharacterized RDD family membrane protein YckC